MTVECKDASGNAATSTVDISVAPKKKGGGVAGRAGAGKSGEAFAGVRRGGGGRKKKKGPLFKAVRRKVKLGEAADGKVEIVGGLEVGEKVIVSAIGQLKNGRLVRVVE